MRKNYHTFLFSLVVLTLFTITAGNVYAQSPIKFGIGVEGGIPVGDASDSYSASAGVSLNVRVPLPVTNLDIIGSVGYQQWFLKGEVKDAIELQGLDVSNYGLLPIRVGARYGFGLLPIFAKFDLGPAITVKEVIDNADSGTAMSYSPGIGTKLGPLEAELKYDIYTKSGDTGSFFGLKLSYYFN
ncbi:hypothetical protein [Olivibacter domesticus]|uniref:hypothetical protein n=1 Tax=Olivibacter domesticus TaxID=407022 RepID=UPI0036075C2A